ncbi:hypothetical protein QVD17_28549 [Tagetes erecta]|uniref:Uncharacterized protein n=1 Tax=Tagetes erecta TaxID=13708 RepID=A0AAD8KF88_TARER|nr:hypothetical protein QVD17_28549 [Tagetes erecta]
MLNGSVVTMSYQSSDVVMASDQSSNEMKKQATRVAMRRQKKDDMRDSKHVIAQARVFRAAFVRASHCGKEFEPNLHFPYATYIFLLCSLQLLPRSTPSSIFLLFVAPAPPQPLPPAPPPSLLLVALVVQAKKQK